MKEKFESLSEEKQRKIINAAYKVFSTYGYKKASTNEIIEEAGISKGLLFHYFKSKKGLYFYIYERGMNLVKEKLYTKIDNSEPDLLARIRVVTDAKIVLVSQYPELFDFLKSAYFEQEHEIKQFVEKTNSEVTSQSIQLLYSNLDLSLFREGIDWHLAVQTINGALEKWAENYISQYKDKSILSMLDGKIEKELDRYMDFFRKSFYKTTT
jgi:AcrR family transcriptional regulator